jgi:hypothetical protein
MNVLALSGHGACPARASQRACPARPGQTAAHARSGTTKAHTMARPRHGSWPPSRNLQRRMLEPAKSRHGGYLTRPRRMPGLAKSHSRLGKAMAHVRPGPARPGMALERPGPVRPLHMYRAARPGPVQPDHGSCLARPTPGPAAPRCMAGLNTAHAYLGHGAGPLSLPMRNLARPRRLPGPATEHGRLRRISGPAIPRSMPVS